MDPLSPEFTHNLVRKTERILDGMDRVMRPGGIATPEGLSPAVRAGMQHLAAHKGDVRAALAAAKAEGSGRGSKPTADHADFAVVASATANGAKFLSEVAAGLEAAAGVAETAGIGVSAAMLLDPTPAGAGEEQALRAYRAKYAGAPGAHGFEPPPPSPPLPGIVPPPLPKTKPGEGGFTQVPPTPPLPGFTPSPPSVPVHPGRDISDGSPAMQFNGDGTSTPILDANGNPVLIDENVPGSGIEPANESMLDPLIGSVHVWNFKPGVLLVPVVRSAKELFTNTAINAEGPGGPSLVVNGEEYGLTKIYNPYTKGYNPLDWLGFAQDPSETVTHGEVIENGQLVAGRSSTRGFYVSEMLGANGTPSFQFGEGNPPANSAAAFGGAIPVIINGLNYGADKVFDSSGNLIQQSNLGYASLDRYPASSGKVVLAYSSQSNQLALVAQPDKASDGMTLTDIRNYLSRHGYNNAIAFDGSSSATLVVNKLMQIAPANYKNSTIDVGIGFKAPKGH